ncbi:MAG: hypothetical protein K8E66_04235, partial [Phycisphaerales bacterium]|nr:hypothetical protein [Phycisphaerales bacterium]
VRQFTVPAAALDLVAAANLRAARLLGYAPMLTPWKLGELRHADWVCKDDAARRAFAWRPRVSLADGIELTLRSFRG